MRMKMDGGWIYIIEADQTQNARIKSWGLMKWSRKNAMWSAAVSGELLNRLSALVPLPVPIEAERRRLIAVQQAVDYERILPADKLKPLAKYPVTKDLYAHQTRAANMALLVFGLAEPEEVYE